MKSAAELNGSGERDLAAIEREIGRLESERMALENEKDQLQKNQQELNSEFVSFSRHHMDLKNEIETYRSNVSNQDVLLEQVEWSALLMRRLRLRCRNWKRRMLLSLESWRELKWKLQNCIPKRRNWKCKDKYIDGNPIKERRFWKNRFQRNRNHSKHVDFS